MNSSRKITVDIRHLPIIRSSDNFWRSVFFYSFHKIFIRFIRFWFAKIFFCFVFNHFNFVLSYSFVVFCAFFFCSLKFFCESNGIENEWQIVGRLRRWMRSEIFISIILIGVVYNDYITCSLEPENRQQTPKQSTRNSECGCVRCALVGFTFVFYFYWKYIASIFVLQPFRIGSAFATVSSCIFINREAFYWVRIV